MHKSILLLCAVAPFPGALPAQSSIGAVSRPTTLASEATAQVRFDQPRVDGPLWALGSIWKASFDENGLSVIPFFGSQAPQNFPLHLRLAQATVGGKALPLAASRPTRSGAVVRTSHGALTEVIDTRPEQIEQSFVFETLPDRDTICVEVSMSSELRATPIAEGVRFANEFGHVDYTKAVAVDAAGRRLPLAIEWTGSGVRMQIPAAFVREAQLPLVLDPVLNFWYLLASGTTQLQHDSDPATITAQGGRTLLVWQRQWSATDQDCFGLMFDGNLGLVATDFVIDLTSEDWLRVAAAGNNYAQNFLVVSEVRTGSLWFIGGRTISANVGISAAFDIERDGVVGLGGNNHHPDVGGDPYFGVGRYTVVFTKQTVLGSQVYMKQVTTVGNIVNTNPTLISATSQQTSRPSISKSCGQSNGQPAHWLVTWQQPYPAAPFDQEVHGRLINWNGALPGSAFGIAMSVGEETAPTSGSPIDANGVRYWPMAYEWASMPGQPREVRCHLLRSDGGLQTNLPISNGVPGSDCREPEMDSDGTRFVIGMTTGSSGLPQSVEAVSVAYLPTTNAFRIEERSALQTSSLQDYDQPSVCANFSGGQAQSSRYVVSFTERTLNTFRLVAFGGHAGDTNFFSYRPSQCGSLPITASGSPVIGQSVTITVTSAGFSGTLLGFPAHIPINIGCACWIGVDQGVVLANPLVWQVPLNPAYVGLPLAVQGWTFAGSQCLNTIDLSDTVDFTIR